MTTEMSDNETVDDVLADMLLPRFDAITAMRANNYDEIKSLVANYRDRIEAAHKREVDKLNSVIQAQRSAFDAEQDRQRRAAPGDAAAMREVVMALAAVILPPRDKAGEGGWLAWVRAMQGKTRAALAAPPRNCDVGTLTEHQQRFRDFCEKMQHTDKACCGGCPIVKLRMNGTIDNSCELAWAQMPYKDPNTKA